jgi:hypothetical protein
VSRGTHELNQSHIPFGYGTITLCGPPFQRDSPRNAVSYSVSQEQLAPLSRTTPPPQRLFAWHGNGLGSSPFARHYSGNTLLSSGYLDVSVPRLTSDWLCVHQPVVWFCHTGFPHSEIPGSMPAGDSPRLFAANHVLLRPATPRHPPCALRSFFCTSLREFYLGSCSAVKVPPCPDGTSLCRGLGSVLDRSPTAEHQASLLLARRGSDRLRIGGHEKARRNAGPHKA